MQVGVGIKDEHEWREKRDSKLCLFFPPITLTLISGEVAT